MCHSVSPSVSQSVSQSVSLSPGDKQLFVLRGINISYTQERGGQTFLHRGGGQPFFVAGGGAYDDIDEELDVSEANFLVSEARRALKF